MSEQKKRTVGRPKKKVSEPIVNESAERLNMDSLVPSDPQKISINDLSQSFKRLYGQVFSASNFGTNKAWAPTMNCLNALNPFLQNERLKQINTQPGDYATEDIIDALNEPQNHEFLLRSAGWSFASNQKLYDDIIRQSCDIPLFKYYKIPELLNDSEYNSKLFKEEDYLIDEWLEKFNIATTLKQKALEVKREGKATYILRNKFYYDQKGQKHVSFVAWEKLPSNYVKLTGIGERGYIASFNMMLFMNPAFNPLQYPEYIQQVWNDMWNKSIIKKDKYNKPQVDFDICRGYKFNYKGRNYSSSLEISKGMYMFWVQLPQDICYTFASDTSHPWVVPDTSSLFLKLKNLDDYNTLASLIASTPLTSVLTGEAEFVDNASAGRDQTKISPETLLGLQNSFNSMTSTNTESFFAPVKNIKLQNLPNTVNSSEILTGATQNVITTSGEGGIIVASDKPSIAQIKGAQGITASRYDFVTKQFESVLNFIIQEMLGLTYKFTIKIFGDIYSIENEKGTLKEMVMGGSKFFLPKLLACEDLTMRNANALVKYIDNLAIYKKLETLTQEKQSELGLKVSNDNSQSQNSNAGAGRPSNENTENDNTAASQEGGNNTSDNKSIYSEIQHKCKICGIEISEGNFCEECIEKYDINQPENVD